MNTTWKYVKKLKDKSSVKAYLEKNHVMLPAELVTIIEQFNGGRPFEKDIVTENNKAFVFKSLLSYNSDDKETIYSVYPELFKESSLYPIGSDAAGNFVCYDCKKQSFCMLNHETDEVDKIVRMPFMI